MKITVVPAAQLSCDHSREWSLIQEADSELASPYFCPEFTAAVASVRSDVLVAVLEQGKRNVGFFPFQRNRLGVGVPVGGLLSDYHGVIAPKEVEWDAEELLRACNLASWTFGYLIAAQTPFQKYHRSTSECHYMDLSQGFQGYVDALRERGSHLIKDMRYKKRRLEREYGRVRFVPHVTDCDVLETLIRWKSEQYRRSSLVDVFAVRWTGDLLKLLLATQTDSFSGRLSALYVGEELAAVHMGMHSRTRWNWWFPRHNEKFARFSPGVLLRVLVAEHAAEKGIKRLDLGFGGEDTYKPRLASGSVLLAQGRVEVPSVVNAVQRLYRNSETWLRRFYLMGVARIPGRLIKRVEQRMRIR